MIFHAAPLAHLADRTRRRRQLPLPASIANLLNGSQTSTSDSQPGRGSSTGSNTDPSLSTTSSPSAGVSADTPAAVNTRQQTDSSPGKSTSNTTDSSPSAAASPLPVGSNPQSTAPIEQANPTASPLGTIPTNSPSPTLATPAAGASASPTPAASGSNRQPLFPSDTPAPTLPSASATALTPGSTPTPVGNTPLAASDRPLTAPTSSPTALSPTLAHSSPQAGLATHDSHGLTSNVNPGFRSAPAPVATGQFSSPSAQGKPKNDSGGLSAGAVTVIAVIAGIVGFIILFWLGVQLLQSKRRKREEEDMQEIDFDPSGGGGSANGDTFQALGINRHPSSGTGHGPAGYNPNPSPRDLAEKPYDEDAHMYGDYPAPPPTTAPLNLTGTVGGADTRGGGRSVQNNPSSGPGSQGFYTLSSGPGTGYYPGDPRQQSYPPASRPDHFTCPQHRFDPGAPIPSHTYEYDSNYGGDGADYSRDPHHAPYIGHVGPNSGVGYGTMIARSTSPPLNFHYPPNSTAAAR